MNTLENRVIMITGATSGIGREVALQAAAKGARIAICGRTQSRMDELIGELDLGEEQVFFRVFDITDEEQVVNFVADAQTHFGQIDILLNNAGGNTSRGKVADIKTADYEYLIKLNQISPFVVMREVFNAMREKQSGQIINVISTVSLFSNPTLSGYTAAKSGFDAMTKIFRKEAAEDGVVVTSVYPGGVNTNFRPADRPEYLSAVHVAESLIAIMEMDKAAAVHEFVLRPHVERNF